MCDIKPVDDMTTEVPKGARDPASDCVCECESMETWEARVCMLGPKAMLAAPLSYTATQSTE